MSSDPYQTPDSDLHVPVTRNYALRGLAWAGVFSFPVLFYTSFLMWGLYRGSNPYRLKLLPYQLLHLIYCLPFFISGWMWGRRLTAKPPFHVIRGVLFDFVLVSGIWVTLRLFLAQLEGKRPDSIEAIGIRVLFGLGICLLIGYKLRSERKGDIGSQNVKR